jgi:acid phosphatase
MFGEEHVSQGNYFWLFSGSNQGVGHLDRPPDSPIDADNLGRALAQKAGRSFKGYVEDLPEPITTNETPQGCTLRDCVYGRKHVPWLGFTDFADDNNHLTTKPFSEWPHEGQFNILPTVAFVIPNLNHDMHNGPVAQSVPRGDTWLAEHMGSYYEWAKRNNSLLIVTFDESNDTNFIGLTDPHAYPGLESDYLRVRRNKIPTVIAGARIMHRDGGYDEGAGITHVNILRTIEAMYGLKKSGGQQGCAAAEGISDHFITDVFARGGNSTTRAVP